MRFGYCRLTEILTNHSPFTFMHNWSTFLFFFSGSTSFVSNYVQKNTRESKDFWSSNFDALFTTVSISMTNKAKKWVHLYRVFHEERFFENLLVVVSGMSFLAIAKSLCNFRWNIQYVIAFLDSSLNLMISWNVTEHFFLVIMTFLASLKKRMKEQN